MSVTDKQLLELPPRRALLQALQAAGGELSPGELSERTGMPASTRARHLARLRTARMLEGNKHRLRLTARGALALSAVSVPDAGPVELAALIQAWPSLEQQSFARLAIGEVVTRRLFGELRPRDLLGLAVIGAKVGTGKTLMGLFCARAVGLEDERVLCRLPERAPGEILGRLENRGEGYRFTPAPQLAQPLALLDELDKCDGAQQRAALAVLGNGPRFEREGELHRQRAVPLLTANKDVPLPDYACRRAIVLDTDPACARGELAGIARFAGRLDELRRAGAFPTIDLDTLVPRTPALPDAERQLVYELLARSLTDERMRTTNTAAVEVLALAYAALTPAASVRGMALAAASDYLLVADTTGGTRQGWDGEHFAAVAQLAGGGELADLQTALEHRQHQQLELHEGRHRRQLERAHTDDQLVEQRAALAQQLADTIGRLRLDRLPGAAADDRADAKGISARLHALREETTAARTLETLDGIRARTSQSLDRARQLVDRIGAEHAARTEVEELLKAARRTLGNVPAIYKPRAQQIRAQLDELLWMLANAHGTELADVARRAQVALTEQALVSGQIEREQTSRQQPATPRRQPDRSTGRPAAQPRRSPRPPLPAVAPAVTAPPALAQLPAVLAGAVEPLRAARVAAVNGRQHATLPARRVAYCRRCDQIWPTAANAGQTITRCPQCGEHLEPVR